MTRRGRLITFEGGEGAGKSTQIERFAGALRGAGIDVLVTREPGGTPGAEQIRTLLLEGAPERWLPLTEVLLLLAARHDHVVRRIAPALSAGHWVLCDRFINSTRVYQGMAGAVGEAADRPAARCGAGRPAPGPDGGPRRSGRSRALAVVERRPGSIVTSR